MGSKNNNIEGYFTILFSYLSYSQNWLNLLCCGSSPHFSPTCLPPSPKTKVQSWEANKQIYYY
jgi:hypothetical protein